MAYATKDQYAVHRNYADWDAMNAATEWPTASKLDRDLAHVATIINGRNGIGSYTDITNATYLTYLMELSCEMIDRKYDKQVPRETDPRAMFNPHDYLYKDEKAFLNEIGINLGYRVVGVTGA